MKRILCACIYILALPCIGYAMPGDMNARFVAADTNRDAVLDREEFIKAFPGMKPEAFAIIDADRNGRISQTEWAGFFKGHGAGASPSQTTVTERNSLDASGVLPLLPIPRSSTPGTPVPPSAPVEQRTPAGNGELPLLSPPSR